MSILKNRLFYAASLMAAFGMSACSNADDTIVIDDFDYSAQMIYLRQPGKTGVNIEYRASKEEGFTITSGTLDEFIELVPVRSTKPAEQDIEVTIGIDTDYVEAYNAQETAAAQEEGRTPQLVALPQHIVLESTKLVIPAGKYLTEPIRAHVLNRDDLINGETVSNLVLPVKILSASAGKVSVGEETCQFCMALKSTYVGNNPYWSPASTTSYELQVDADGNRRNALDEVSLNARLTVPFTAESDITVKLRINYDLIPDSSYPGDKPLTKPQLASSTMKIAAGEKVSTDIVKILFPDNMAEMVADTNYLIPIEIESSEGFGVNKGTTSQVIYYRITARGPKYITFNATEAHYTLYCSKQDGSPMNGAAGYSFGTNIKITQAPSAYARAYLKIDNDLIATYNAEHQTNYEAVPSSCTVAVKTGTGGYYTYMYIYANSLEGSTSYPLYLTFSDSMASFETGKTYIIPVTFDRLECNDTLVAFGSTDNVVYVIIKTEAIDPPLSAGTAAIGTEIDRDGMSARYKTSESSTYDTDCSTNLLGRGSTYQYMYANYLYTVDLGNEYNLKTIEFNWYASDQGLKVAHIWVSTDNQTWTDLVTVSLTAGKQQFLIINNPTKIRYVKIQSNGSHSTYARIDGTQGVKFYKQ